MACINGYGRKNKTESHFRSEVETEFSPPATRSRRNKHIKKLISDDTTKEGHITNYFQVVGSVNCFEKPYEDKLFDAKSDSFMNGVYKNFDSFENDNFNIDVDNINELIYPDNVDNKKTILNNIFKKDSNAQTHNRSLSVSENGLIAEGGIKNEFDPEFLDVNIENENVVNGNNEDIYDVLNVRLSPRKHASTLQRCVMVKENIKTPHRISLCENTESPTHGIKQIAFRPNKHRTRRRLVSKFPKTKSKTQNTDLIQPIKSEDVSTNGDNLINGQYNNIDETAVVKSENQLKINGNFTENHKLTEYFPVRRSVRKTKKEVMEQKLKDLEIAIEKQREDGLEVASFEGKGRGIIAARKFYRGEFVVEYAGELVDSVEARQREIRYAEDHATGCYMYYFRHNNQPYCIDATPESGRLGRLVNHSRNGNLITKTIFLKSKPHLVLIANQDIEMGEEVTYDYGDRSKESLQHHPWLAL